MSQNHEILKACATYGAKRVAQIATYCAITGRSDALSRIGLQADDVAEMERIAIAALALEDRPGHQLH